MFRKITLLKLASRTQDDLHVKSKEQDLILLEYLKNIKDYPIASSCNGQGVCKKCVFNEQFLLCEITVKNSPKEISISYL